MTRRPGGIVIVATVLALVCAPLLASEAKQPPRYVDRERGFSIALPPGWTQTPITQQDITLTAASPRKRENGTPEANLAVSMTKFGNKITLEDFYDSVVASLPKQVQDYKQADTGNLSLGTDPGKYVIYTFSAAGTAMKGVSVFSIRGSRAASISCVTTPDLYADYEGTFEEIAGSFKFEAPTAQKRGPAQYTSPDNAFSISLPGGWTVSEPGTQPIIVQAASPLSDPTDKVRESITVAVTTGQTPDLDAMAKQVIAGFPKELKVELIDTVPFKIDGHDARRVACCLPANKPRITNNIYLTRDRTKLYIITCSCNEEAFGDAQLFFDKVVRTFKFHAQTSPAAPAATGRATGRK
jgi:hypothetical protein